MNNQREIMVSVCLALLIHICAAYLWMLKADVTTVQFAEYEQGISISLAQGAYQQILQEQQAVKTVQKKTVQSKPVEPKKIKVKKQQKMPVIQQKVIAKKLLAKATVYQVQEQAVNEVNTVEEAVTHVPPEMIKVASVTDTFIQASRQALKQKGNAGEDGSADQKTLDMSDSATKRYLAQLMRHLRRYKQYPALLKKNHVEGKPVIRFSINKSGHVTNVEVKRRSSNAELDQTAMDVFRRASPLPKIPSELERDSLTMSLPIEYSLIND